MIFFLSLGIHNKAPNHKVFHGFFSGKKSWTAEEAEGNLSFDFPLWSLDKIRDNYTTKTKKLNYYSWKLAAKYELWWSLCQKVGTEHIIFFCFPLKTFSCWERRCQVLPCMAGKNSQCRTGQPETPSTCKKGSHGLSVKSKQVQWELWGN